MSRRLSTGVVIWACLCLIVGKSYAWDDPVIYMIPGLTHEPLSYYDVGKEYFYADVISGGPIEEWVWHWPEGAYDIEEYYWPDHSVGLCRFASTGKYWVGATGYTEWLGSDTDWAEVYVFEMDLDIAGVSDGAEYDPGGYIAYNNDDDNENGTPDKDEAGTVTGEDNLVGISLSYEPACLTPGYIELKTPYGGEDIIRVWTDSDKQNLVIPNGSDPYKRWPIGTQPSTLYVEGYGVGTAQLWLLYTLYTPPDTYVYPGGGSYNHDPVKFTVVQVVDVAVDVSDNDTHEIPSMQDASQVPDDHFVTVKGVPGNITLKATISPDTDDARNAITWTGMTQDPEDKLKATKSRAAAGKFPATINVSGRDAKDLTNWVVWSTPSPPPELHYDEEEGGIKEEVEEHLTMIHGGYDVTHAIIPASIIPDSMEPVPDVPDLRGANNDDPNDVPEEDRDVVFRWLNPKDGANKKWDHSRQVRQNILNPDGLDLTKLVTPWVEQLITSYPIYPYDDVCGNDDCSTEWEDNNPYSDPHKGCVWGEDGPKEPAHHEEGELGNTHEKRVHLRSFARLNIGGRWYRISGWCLWKVHLKFKMQNESEAEWDLDFNDDGDKLDTVPVWRNNGSFNALDNEDFD